MHTYDFYKDLINEHLTDYIPEVNPLVDIIRESMTYSLECGGKRVRPVMLLAACEFAGGDIMEALPYACALEYIHTYSLIHDDLPAMDDDDLRRGKPTNHVVYGEDIAILAGDALLNTANEVMFRQLALHNASAFKVNNHVKAGLAITEAAGINGMIGGQVCDVKNEHNECTPEILDYIDANKTGALLTAPVVAGLHIAGASSVMIEDFRKYAKNLGKAFQVSDDILDAIGSAEDLGKKTGKDEGKGKCNNVAVNGLEQAISDLHTLTENAIHALDSYGVDAAFFTDLALTLERRKH